MKADFSTLLGLGGTALVILIAIKLGGSQAHFFDPASFLLVLGGTLLALLARRSGADFLNHLRATQVVFHRHQHNIQHLSERLRQWSIIARREGTLALENEARATDPRIMTEALLMLVDGVNEDSLREGMQARVAALEERHRRIISTWEDWVVVAPAMGMIGTLIGLVQMLGKMHDATEVGNAMALALLTTLYGAFLANVIAAPIASKLQLKHAEETAWCEALIAGITQVSRGAGPHKTASAVVMPFRIGRRTQSAATAA